MGEKMKKDDVRKAGAEKDAKKVKRVSPQTMKTIHTVVMVMGKVAEVGSWIGAVGMILVAVTGFASGAFPGYIWDIFLKFPNMDFYGLKLVASDGVSVNFAAIGWFGVGMALVMATMAMAFRNVYLIARNAREATPFTEENAWLLNWFGVWLLIAGGICGVTSLVIYAMTGAEVTSNGSMIMAGLLMLYLAQIFARGVELEKKK